MVYPTMYFNGNNEEAVDPLVQTSNEARAHALESALTTMENFLENSDWHQFITAFEPIYRAEGDTYRTFAEAIAEAQTRTQNESLSDAERAAIGYEQTRFILLVRRGGKSSVTVVLYEGQVSGKKGYGVLNLEAGLRVREMEAFTSPQHLLDIYGDEAILDAAAAIEERKLLFGIQLPE